MASLDRGGRVRSIALSVRTAAEKAVYSAASVGHGVSGEFGEEEQPVERHFRHRGGDLFRRVEHAPGATGAPEARALRIDRAVTEGRRQQIVEVTAFGRDRRLGLLDQLFEQSLLVQRVDELQRRDAVLRLDQTPHLAFEPDFFRRERAGCPGRQ